MIFVITQYVQTFSETFVHGSYFAPNIAGVCAQLVDSLQM